MPEIIKKYFQAFSKKDLDTLSELYSDNVVLWEWGEKFYLGKLDVLNSNKDLFGKFSNINVLLKSHAHSEDNKYFCEAIVVLDNNAVSFINVFVVENDKIVSIAAYRGF